MNKTIAEQQKEIIHKRNELRLLNIDKDVEGIELKKKEIKELQDSVIARVQELINNYG